MKKKIQIVLGLLCIGVLGSSACGGAKSKEYQAAVEIYNRELSRDRGSSAIIRFNPFSIIRHIV